MGPIKDSEIVGEGKRSQLCVAEMRQNSARQNSTVTEQNSVKTGGDKIANDDIAQRQNGTAGNQQYTKRQNASIAEI